MSEQSPQLWGRVSELKASAEFLLYLTRVASSRLSLTQAAFFLVAAACDVAGKPATRTQILESNEETFGVGARNTYRQLLESSRAYPNALGWLRTERNPDDDRERFLRLTPAGKLVVSRVVLALRPIGHAI